MSFRAAYHSLGSRRAFKPQPFRDPAPEQWAKQLAEYYRQQRKNK